MRTLVRTKHAKIFDKLEWFGDFKTSAQTIFLRQRKRCRWRNRDFASRNRDLHDARVAKPLISLTETLL